MTKVGILKNALMTIGNFIDIPIPPAVLELCKQLLLHSPACYQVHIIIQNRVAQSVISDLLFTVYYSLWLSGWVRDNIVEVK